MLAGKKGIITGVANDRSISYGCAEAIRSHGGEFVLTYGSDKTQRYVAPIAEAFGADLVQCDVSDNQAVDSLFTKAREKWGDIDFLIHSIAFADKETLHNRVVDSSWDGFAKAMDISCHSFVRLAKRAEAAMPRGGSLICMSYHGAQKVVTNYGVMGPIKACLEACVRYLAHELGRSNIRVYAMSPGPIATRAASGLKDFDQLVAKAQSTASSGRLVSIEEVGDLSAFLVSEMARGMTGQTIYVDYGANIYW